MKPFYCTVGALLTAATGAAAGSLGAGNRNIWARGDNVTAFSNFAKALGLSDADIKSLGDKQAQATATELACMTAHHCLGTAQVDTTPVNSTIVDENWYIGSSSLVVIRLMFFLVQVRDVFRTTFLHHSANEFDRRVECIENYRLLPGVLRRPKWWSLAQPGLVQYSKWHSHFNGKVDRNYPVERQNIC